MTPPPEMLTYRQMQEFSLYLGVARSAAVEEPRSGTSAFRHERTVTLGGPAPREWSGEPFAVDPDGYYRVVLVSRSAEHGHAALIYSDAAGQTLVADNYDRIGAADDWTAAIAYVRPPPAAVTARLKLAAGGDTAFDMREARVDRASEAEAGDWVAGVLGRLPPIAAGADEGAGSGLSQTRRRLAAGVPLRAVFLGDSIMNDIGNGLPGLQIRRRCPGAAVTVISSVRGSSGCPVYQQEGQVREAVLNHAPDLVVIGGISHNYDIDAIRSVIRQIRAVPAVEILVMTGAVRPETETRERLLQTEPSLVAAAERVRAFARGLAALPREEGVAVFDLRRAWDRWLAASGYPAAVFMRDAVHANRVGKLVLGALVAEAICGEA